MPWYLSTLAKAYGKRGQLDGACRRIDEAITMTSTTEETWSKAEVNRIAGEIAVKSPEPDAAKAEAYFERALSEPPVDWSKPEGFDTRDLKHAKTLLEELAA